MKNVKPLCNPGNNKSAICAVAAGLARLNNICHRHISKTSLFISTNFISVKMMELRFVV